MRPNRKRPESAAFWFQSLCPCCCPHCEFLHVARMAASYNGDREQVSLLRYLLAKSKIFHSCRILATNICLDH